MACESYLTSFEQSEPRPIVRIPDDVGFAALTSGACADAYDSEVDPTMGQIVIGGDPATSYARSLEPGTDMTLDVRSYPGLGPLELPCEPALEPSGVTPPCHLESLRILHDGSSWSRVDAVGSPVLPHAGTAPTATVPEPSAPEAVLWGVALLAARGGRQRPRLRRPA